MTSRSTNNGGIVTMRRRNTDSHTRESAKELRKAPTDPERLLWFLLRSRRFVGYKFRRQYPVGSFIVDFCCPEAKVIVELDGGQHGEAIEYDERRTEFLKSQGYKVIRLWNNELMSNTQGALEYIYNAVVGC